MILRRDNRIRLTVALSAAAVAALVAGAIPASGVAQKADAAPIPPQGNGYISVASDRTGDLEIYRMRSDGDNQMNLTNKPTADDYQPAYSPDGKKIAFTSNRDGNLEVYIMNSDGSGVPKNLTNSPSSSDSEPTWAPDGSKLAFTSNRDGNLEIYTINVNGTGLANFSNDPTYAEYQPAWSPTGGQIAFTTDRPGNADVYVMKINGTNRTDLTNNPASDSQPAWSPTGQRIAFTSDRDGNNEVYMMSPDGTFQTNLTSDPGSDSLPVFSPDMGTRVAFTSNRQGEKLTYIVNVYTPTGFTYGTVAVTHIGDSVSDPSWQPLPAPPAISTPIQNVVVIDLENHSFDNIFGKMCVQEARCLGTTQGKLFDGTTIDLPPAQDIMPRTLHSYGVQVGSINGGLMNGWSQYPFCDEQSGYDCFQQFQPSQVPTMTDLAHNFAISDHSFELDTVGSWGGHTDLATTNLNGFYTATPVDGTIHQAPGWGCDGNDDSLWAPTPTDLATLYPTCIPQPDGTGPYRPSPVSWEPTIMDRLVNAGKNFRIYAPTKSQPGYGWAICPTFADCLYTSQSNSMVKTSKFVGDAAAGTLRNLSIVIPQVPKSEHNGNSMLEGENWLASVINAIMAGPQWNSTAVFITYDDCGCFYDHVNPPAGLGIRIPFVIVSPYARAMFVDTNVASYASPIAFTEHIFGLAPMSVDDAAAYDYMDSFNFAQKPIAPYRLKQHKIPAWEKRWLKAHPPEPDFT